MNFRYLRKLLYLDITSARRSMILNRQIPKRKISNKMTDSDRPEHLQLTKDQKLDPDVFEAEISCIQQLSPTIKGFTLQLTSKTGLTPSFKAGQWVDFFIPGLEKVGGYSMCSEPKSLETEGKLELAVKYSTWAPAKWLHAQAQIGSKVAFKVGGELHYPNKIIEAIDGKECEHDVLLIAGGVGINPLASIFFHLNQIEEDKKSSSHKNGVRVHLLYSSRTKNELIFCDRIRDIVASNKVSREKMNRQCSFNSTFFVTQENEHESDIRNKRIEMDEIKEALNLFSDCDTRKSSRPLFCFLCGPPNMIKDIARILVDLGIPKERVMYEMWW